MTAQHARALDLRAHGAVAAPPAANCTVTVCRGCCCGTVDKHPDVDHVGQLRQLQDGIGPAGRVRTTGCLSSCDHSNVVVVQPSAWGRVLGGRPFWLRQVLTPALTDAVVDWVRSGGPGVAEPPEILRAQGLSPARQRRTAPLRQRRADAGG